MAFCIREVLITIAPGNVNGLLLLVRFQRQQLHIVIVTIRPLAHLTSLIFAKNVHNFFLDLTNVLTYRINRKEKCIDVSVSFTTYTLVKVAQ